MTIINKFLSLIILTTLTLTNFSILNIADAQYVSPPYDSTPIIYDTLLPVIPDHNNLETTDRINIVFSVRAKENEFYSKLLRSNLPDILGWNGPIVTKNEKEEVEVKRNFFATDPIRNYKNKFNIWIFYEKNSKIVKKDSFNAADNIVYNSLVNKVIITIDNNGQDATFGRLRTYAGSGFRLGKTNDDYIYDLGIPNGQVSMSSRPQKLLPSSNFGYILSHELGHAIFNFGDEYSTDLVNPFYQYKYDNKPKTLEELTQFAENNIKCIDKLGLKTKYMGKLDSVYDEIIEDYNALGINNEFKKIDFQITYFDYNICSGKYSSNDIDNFSNTINPLNINGFLTDGVARSNIYSIMGGGKDIAYNIWGSAKKDIIESLLSEFKGYGEKIPYVKKEFKKSDYQKIIDTPHKELYQKELLRIDQIFSPETIIDDDKVIEPNTFKNIFIINQKLIVTISGIMFIIILFFYLHKIFGKK
jgi:hypothetical protein